MTTSDSPKRRERSGAAGCGFAALVLTGLVVAVWMLWGFRWPPTGEVVVDPVAEDQQPREE